MLSYSHIITYVSLGLTRAFDIIFSYVCLGFGIGAATHAAQSNVSDTSFRALVIKCLLEIHSFNRLISFSVTFPLRCRGGGGGGARCSHYAASLLVATYEKGCFICILQFFTAVDVRRLVMCRGVMQNTILNKSESFYCAFWPNVFLGA